MKATLLLTEVVLVVVLGGTFSSAKTINSLEWNENSAFEKRENEDRVRRNFDSFQSQINEATSLSIVGVDCSPSLCTSNLSLDLCQAFCRTNITAFAQILTSLGNCYQGGLCGRNFSSVKLTDVNISLAVDSFDGQCTLYGSNVTLTLANNYPGMARISFPTLAVYNANFVLHYTFEGLSVRCQPNVHGPSPNQTANQNVNQSVSQSSNKNDSFSLVQHLLVFCNVIVDEFDCQNDASLVDKRQAESTPVVVYDGPVSVDLFLSFFPVFIYSPGVQSFQTSGLSESDADVTLGSGVGGGGIPSDYQAQVQLGIQNVFLNYNVWQNIISNFFYIISNLLDDFHDNKCSSTCNS